MLVPPLRIPLPMDVKAALSNWLDNRDDTSGPPDFSAAEVGGDLDKLHALRSQLSDAITTHDSYDQAKELIPVMHEYHAMLMECSAKGFPATTSISFAWKQQQGGAEQQASTNGIVLERASILWNLAAIEAHNASMQNVASNKKAWMLANKNLQLSFTLCHHLHELLVEANATPRTGDLSMVSFWKNALQAQAQMAGYEKASQTSRPKHLLLAKIAQAACPLWDQAAAEITTTAQQQQYYSWLAKAWSAHLSAKAEYHESAVQLEKKQPGPELARLEKCLRFATTCQECLGHIPNDDASSERLHRDFPVFFQLVQDRYAAAQQELPPGVDIPNDLPNVRGELLSKTAGSLPKTMKELSTPMFTNLMGPVARQHMERFSRDMDQFVSSMSQMVESKTEGARKALARVNLPHSLTAYKQEQSGGGIPMELWERVDAIQRDRKIATLKQELWGLRDVAEQARSIYSKTEKQLQEDVDMDKLFRQQNPSFEGHDVNEIQQTFRQSCANYEKLLSKSQEGDAVLLRRLEVLDQDPKYKLLQFGKSQLDRLLPGNGGNQAPNIDTTHLSRLLVELSNLFHEREVTLGVLKDEVKNFDIREKMNQVNPESPMAEQEYQLTVKKAQKSFSGIAYEIQLNIDKQMELLDTIMQENEHFMQTREAGASSAASESCIAMIEDAIEEIDQLTKHLREGKDFYDVVIPKLEDLKQEVGDASVRLTVERCEFEDNHMNSASVNRQMEEDARMAASLAGGGAPPPTPPSGDAEQQRPGEDPHQLEQPGTEYQPSSDVAPAASHPGVVNVSHAEPQVRVDDEKVASLIAMDFDPDKVVAALRKYDNNVEQALNELLCG